MHLYNFFKYINFNGTSKIIFKAVEVVALDARLYFSKRRRFFKRSKMRN